MAFLNKKQVEEYAEENGLDISGMTWPQKQKAISDHMKETGNPMPAQSSPKKEAVDEEIARLKRELEETREKVRAVPQVPVVFERGKAQVAPTIEDYENVVLIASPEQRPTQFQKRKWYENVGTEKTTEEVHFDVGGRSPFGTDGSGTRNATYKVTETGRPVTAESTMPKYSCLPTYRPTKDLCAVAEYGGHKGYLWTHHRLPNIRAMLEQAGAYEEYKHFWQDQPGRVFYLGGLLCCDISFTDNMMKRIQRELRKRGDEDER